ncbi:transmembrane protein [Thalictrum thalictroides]|uniref:Transmembrane protein n=1 Tax=Thalictrum thalictroides TaxID=46969 RepID=A0A7J6X826_THATH|nr:transmembrane protein [Thalictrum thalictroides]
MENRDDWLALDKLEHVLFCFFISIFITTLLNQTRYSFLRRWSNWFGSIVSISAGVAKEIGDEIGLWNSAGASFKDGIADLLGTLLASIFFQLFNSFYPISNKSQQVLEISGIELV